MLAQIVHIGPVVTDEHRSSSMLLILLRRLKLPCSQSLVTELPGQIGLEYIFLEMLAIQLVLMLWML